MEKKNVHKDHRQRVKARYLSEGSGNMTDHNVMELLLFFGIPYKDTNEIAHEMVETFGDINGILDAPVEELMRLKGVGENAATLIHLIRDIAIRYENHKKREEFSIAGKDRLEDFLKMKFAGETRELMYMLVVNALGKLEKCVKLCEGSPDSIIVDKRRIMEAALRNDARTVIIAHNHPHGFAVPSVADIRTTNDLIPLLSSVGIHLIDHVIVSDDDAFSMARSKKYSQLF